MQLLWEVLWQSAYILQGIQLKFNITQLIIIELILETITSLFSNI